jgi:hypothetical protein
MRYRIVPGDQHDGLEYVVTNVGCYLYAKDGMASHCWRLYEIVQERPVTTLEEPDLERYTKLPAVDSLPDTVRNWREKRCRDHAVAELVLSLMEREGKGSGGYPLVSYATA